MLKAWPLIQSLWDQDFAIRPRHPGFASSDNPLPPGPSEHRPDSLTLFTKTADNSLGRSTILLPRYICELSAVLSL